MSGPVKSVNMISHIDDTGKHCLPLPFTCLGQLNGGSMGGGGQITHEDKTAFYINSGENNDFWDYKLENGWNPPGPKSCMNYYYILSYPNYSETEWNTVSNNLWTVTNSYD